MFQEQFFIVRSDKLWPSSDTPQSGVKACKIDQGPTNSVDDAARIAADGDSSYITLYSWTVDHGIRVVALWRRGVMDQALAHIAGASLSFCPKALKIAIGRYIETAMRAAECESEACNVPS